MARCAVLFACKNSVYHEFPVDVYDKSRNALNFKGGIPVIAHPPCRAWASLRHKAKPEPGEKELSKWAIKTVRDNGGILEHPQTSRLWPEMGLPIEPGKPDRYGGFTLIVDQFWFGHRAKKTTRLYIVGLNPKEIPPMNFKLGEATHTVGLWSGRNRATCKPSINKSEYEKTPFEFAK